MRHGFTLIELSIALVIIGLLSGVGLQASHFYLERSKTLVTRDRLTAVKDALFHYRSQHNAFPCPARPTDMPGIASYGRVSDCAVAAPTGSGLVSSHGVRIGSVPFRDLNLSDDFGADGWNQKFFYAITESLALVSSYAAADGAISIYDGHGNSVSTPSDQVAFVLISTGKNRKGSYGARSQIIGPPCDSGSIESENCNLDHRFHDAAFNNGSEAGALFTDDHMVWGMKAAATVTGGGGYIAYNYRGITANKYRGNKLMKADQECRNLYGGNARVLRNSMLTMLSTPDIAEDAWIYCDTPLGSPGCTDGGQYTNGLLTYGTYIDSSGEINALKATLGLFKAACADHQWMGH